MNLEELKQQAQAWNTPETIRDYQLARVAGKQFPWPGLPKWPALVVTGNSVHPQRAAAILIRTDSCYFCGNDRQWEKMLAEAAGLEMDKYGTPTWESVEKYRKDYQILDLEYLVNNRVYSNWIGGPHGWCDWAGNIGCHSSNIGKYPSAEEVLQELSIIAAAFPFLKMQIQLFDGESCQDGIRPVIEYYVDQGHAWPQEAENDAFANPGLTLPVPALWASISFGASVSKRERGCTIEDYKNALKLTRESLEI